LVAGENCPAEDIIIHYGLNDSHSRSWVQENGNGDVGISYFQRHEGSPDQGTLIYKVIQPDGTADIDSVTQGRRLEKSVLLFDSLGNPHIFVAQSNNTDQVIDHHYRDASTVWQSETIIHFYNEGGKFIYELSAAKGPDHSFHLLILKTRSDIDSDDFMDAWINSYLYHLTNATGTWVKELVRNYDMAYTYDMYVKTSSRQDIKVDKDGYIHVTFSEQLRHPNDRSRLWYGTNKTGVWEFEVALNSEYNTRDDAGWFPSLCLDNNGVPYISTVYIDVVHTGSATYCKLYLLKRLGDDNWQAELIADRDDGYYGHDGRKYTGGLTHLVFDEQNTPHIIFADIASSHWPVLNQRLNVGNIRYGVFDNGVWVFQTIYRQPIPTGFYTATEMYGMCLVVSDQTDLIRVIGQELIITGSNQYTCGLVEFAWSSGPVDVPEDSHAPLPGRCSLFQNYPNPFNGATAIEYDLSLQSRVKLSVCNLLGQQIKVLVDDELPAGSHAITWDGTDSRGKNAPTGVYFCRLEADDFAETRKMLLVK